MSEPALLAALAVRTSLIAVLALAGLRVFGKRQLGQMNVYDLAMVIALANAVQNAMTRGSGHILAGIASAGTMLVLSGVLSFVVVRRPGLEAGVVGSPTLLVHEGRLIHQHLRSEHISAEQVLAAVRERGFGDLSEVLNATLEVDGSISVISTDAPSRRHERALPPKRGAFPAGSPEDISKT